MPMWPFKKTPTAQQLTDSNIGEVLKKLGAIGESDLSEAVRIQREKQAAGNVSDQTRLGEILVAMGKITQDDLAMALEVQKKIRTASKGEAVFTLAESQVKMTHARAERTRSSIELACAKFDA